MSDRCDEVTLSSLLFQVVLQLEKKLFSYVNQDVFRENNGTPVSPAFLNVELPAAETF